MRPSAGVALLVLVSACAPSSIDEAPDPSSDVEQSSETGDEIRVRGSGDRAASGLKITKMPALEIALRRTAGWVDECDYRDRSSLPNNWVIDMDVDASQLTGRPARAQCALAYSGGLDVEVTGTTSLLFVFECVVTNLFAEPDDLLVFPSSLTVTHVDDDLKETNVKAVCEEVEGRKVTEICLGEGWHTFDFKVSYHASRFTTEETPHLEGAARFELTPLLNEVRPC